MSVFRLGVSDSRVQAIVAGQVAPLPSLGGGGRPPDRFVAFPQVVSVALGGGWSNMRVTCDAGGGGSAPCALLPPPRSAARSYVVKAAGLAGLRVTEASDALHTRLTDSEMVCEAVGWTGSGGRNFTLAAHDRAAAASPVAAAAVAPGVQQLLEGGSEGAPRLLLHNAATAVVARLVVAMTLPRASAGGARERVTVSVRAGTPLALPDSATDIFVTVDVWRPALGEAWCDAAHPLLIPLHENRCPFPLAG